ncbi:MAG TPA: hypothetical protein VJ553_00055 [Candidatus Paceibacterota bacterium]|nr:hypothetical protein [Candidatus Paceibacterota bacterium]
MRHVIRWGGPVVMGALFAVSFAAAQETSSAVSENRTIGHLIIAALASASVTLLYVVVLHVNSRRRS